MSRTSPRTYPRRPALGSTLIRGALPIGVLGGGLLLASALRGSEPPTATSTLLARIAAGALLTVAVAVTIVVMARWVDRRPLRDIGITPPGDGWRAFTSGALAWLAPATAAFAVLALAGTSLTPTTAAVDVATRVALVLLAVLLSEALPEELVFRAHLMGVLGERTYGWRIVIAQALVFTAFALVLGGNAGIVDLMLYAAMGIGLGYLRMVTGSVWTAVGFHTAFQTGSQLVLTHHDVVEFTGSLNLAMLALGAVPFAIGATAITLLATTRPSLSARPG